jgi:hypothetical protein
MVARDSKVPIDWIARKAKLNLLYLNPWKSKITSLKDTFNGVKFMHVHRKFNTEADTLSKHALSCSIRWLYCEESIEGSVVNADRFLLF